MIRVIKVVVNQVTVVIKVVFSQVTRVIKVVFSQVTRIKKSYIILLLAVSILRSFHKFLSKHYRLIQ